MRATRLRGSLHLMLVLTSLCAGASAQDIDFDFAPPPAQSQQSQADSLDLEFLDVAISYAVSDTTKLFGMLAHEPDLGADLVVLDATHRLDASWAIGGSYIFLDARDGPESHTWRTHVDLHFNTGRLKWVIRNAWDYRLSAGGSEIRNRFRSRFRAEYGGKAWGRPYFVYGFVEPILDLTDEGLSNVNASVGTYFQVYQRVYFNMLYFRSENRRGVDANLTSLGLVFVF